MSKIKDGIGAQLSFALYGAMSRVVRMYKPFLEPFGLTFPQYLAILDLLDGSPRTVGELGSRLGMDTGTITPLLKRLQAAGMVTRTRDINDERRVMVELTDASRAIETDLRSINSKIESACQLTEDGINDLRFTLDALGYPSTDQSQADKKSEHQR